MNTIWALASIIGVIITIMWVRQERAKVPKGTVNTTEFTQAEKIKAIILVILSPLVSGAIFYYSWIKRLPKKAKAANTYSLVVFLVLIIINVVF